MSIRSRHRHRRFDEQPSTELALGGYLELEEEGDEQIVRFEPDGDELKRWEA